MPREPRNLLIGLGLFAATLLAYWPAVTGDFIWNDDDYVTAPALRSLEGLWRIWFEVGATEQYYPFLHSAFWLEHKVWGDSPAGYHLINIFLHAGSACVLAAILRRLASSRAGASPSPATFSSDGAAWLAAFVFALHPVYVESVAWISEQKNTLSLFFYLFAGLLYLRFDVSRRRSDYLLATAVFIVGLLSKSTTATLPPALLVVFWWRRGRLEGKRDVLPLLPWFALGAAMGLFSAYVERRYIGAEGSEFALSLLQRSLLAGRIAWFYFWKLIWPGNLIFIYPRWEIDPAEARQWLYSTGAIGLVVALWAVRRWSRAPLAAALFFGGSLFPVLGFFNVYAFRFSFVADHWQYLPSIGIVVFGSAVLSRALRLDEPIPDGPARKSREARRVSGVGPGSPEPGYISRGGVRRILPILLVAALGALSFQQSRMYADIRTFYRTTLARNPAAWMAHNNLGNLLREDGRLEEAITHYEAALRVRSDLEKVHNNLANCLRDLKRPHEALGHFQRAIELVPDYGEAHNNLGRLLREMGHKEQALRHLITALGLAADDADVRNNLGMVLRDLGRVPESIVQFERAVRLDPRSSPAHLNLALSLSLVGRNDEAMEHYREARRLNPRIPELRQR